MYNCADNYMAARLLDRQSYRCRLAMTGFILLIILLVGSIVPL